MKGNKLIAEFMGMQHTDIGWYDNEEALKLKDNTFDKLNFHTSWDWLMPVVGKITRDEKYWENDYREHLMDIIPYAHIEDVYDAVVGFIKNCVSLEKQ